MNYAKKGPLRPAGEISASFMAILGWISKIFYNYKRFKWPKSTNMPCHYQKQHLFRHFNRWNSFMPLGCSIMDWLNKHSLILKESQQKSSKEIVIFDQNLNLWPIYGLFWSWMIGPNQITVPVRIGRVERDLNPKFIWSGPWSEIWSVSVPISGQRTGPNEIGPNFRTTDRIEKLWTLRYRPGPEGLGPDRIRTGGPIIHDLTFDQFYFRWLSLKLSR